MERPGTGKMKRDPAFVEPLQRRRQQHGSHPCDAHQVDGSVELGDGASGTKEGGVGETEKPSGEPLIAAERRVERPEIPVGILRQAQGAEGDLR